MSTSLGPTNMEKRFCESPPTSAPTCGFLFADRGIRNLVLDGDDLRGRVVFRQGDEGEEHIVQAGEGVVAAGERIGPSLAALASF